MEELLIKFNHLTPFQQRELLDFLDFLLQRGSQKKALPLKQYKEAILQVSTWSEEDLAVFEETKKQFNQWKISEW